MRDTYDSESSIFVAQIELQDVNVEYKDMFVLLTV